MHHLFQLFFLLSQIRITYSAFLSLILHKILNIEENFQRNFPQKHFKIGNISPKRNMDRKGRLGLENRGATGHKIEKYDQ